MPPNKKEKTKFPRRGTKPVNLDQTVYDLLVEMATSEDRPIKTQLERIIKEYYKRWK